MELSCNWRPILLRASAPARILNTVSSFAANCDATDLQFSKRKYDGFKAYAQSKQALRMLTFGLAKRLEGTGITANAVEPGFVRTDLNRNAKGLVPTLINLSVTTRGPRRVLSPTPRCRAGPGPAPDSSRPC